MHCINYGTEIREEAQFCRNCGERLFPKKYYQGRNIYFAVAVIITISTLIVISTTLQEFISGESSFILGMVGLLPMILIIYLMKLVFNGNQKARVWVAIILLGDTLLVFLIEYLSLRSYSLNLQLMGFGILCFRIPILWAGITLFSKSIKYFVSIQGQNNDFNEKTIA